MEVAAPSPRVEATRANDQNPCGCLGRSQGGQGHRDLGSPGGLCWLSVETQSLWGHISIRPQEPDPTGRIPADIRIH